MEGISTLSNTEATILYIDDQPSHRMLFEKTFRGNWLVLTTASPEEALQILEEHDIFLVVADHNMPGVTGIDFLAQAKEVSPKTVRAILSAYSDEALKAEATRRAQIAAYLEKPWDKKKIRAFIEESFLNFIHGVTEPAPRQDYETVLRARSVPIQGLSELVSMLGEKIDEQAARRIALSFAEPRIKDFVPLIRRPVAASLRQATQAAVSGQTREMEKALLDYLKTREPSLSPEPDRH